MKTEYIAIVIMILIASALLYYGFIHFIKSKKLKPQGTRSQIDIDVLVQALGGISNIEDVSHSPSKLTVIVKDRSLIQVATIQELGASGVVEGKNTLSMIFGKQSALIAEDLKNYS